MYTGFVLSTVVSVRVPLKVKEILERHGVNIAEMVRRVLEDEARRLEEQDITNALDELAMKYREKISPKELAILIRKCRDER
mgnify:CR=1 FL=1